MVQSGRRDFAIYTSQTSCHNSFMRYREVWKDQTFDIRHWHLLRIILAHIIAAGRKGKKCPTGLTHSNKSRGTDWERFNSILPSRDLKKKSFVKGAISCIFSTSAYESSRQC